MPRGHSCSEPGGLGVHVLCTDHYSTAACIDGENDCRPVHEDPGHNSGAARGLGTCNKPLLLVPNCCILHEVRLPSPAGLSLNTQTTILELQETLAFTRTAAFGSATACRPVPEDPGHHPGAAGGSGAAPADLCDHGAG